MSSSPLLTAVAPPTYCALLLEHMGFVVSSRCSGQAPLGLQSAARALLHPMVLGCGSSGPAAGSQCLVLTPDTWLGTPAGALLLLQSAATVQDVLATTPRSARSAQPPRCLASAAAAASPPRGSTVCSRAACLQGQRPRPQQQHRHPLALRWAALWLAHGAAAAAPGRERSHRIVS